MSDPLTPEAIARLAASAREDARDWLPGCGVHSRALTTLALIAAHNAANHRKADANYAAHVTCQHGREPDAPCVPCSWAARIVELERENAALKEMAKAVQAYADVPADDDGAKYRARVALWRAANVWKAGNHE